jgi:hypothetical protein
MITQQVYQNVSDLPNQSASRIEGKVEELTQSISEVYNYELLTTNQYLKQMELVLEIFHEITDILAQQ